LWGIPEAAVEEAERVIGNGIRAAGNVGRTVGNLVGNLVVPK
jgi:hypothetical protein